MNNANAAAIATIVAMPVDTFEAAGVAHAAAVDALRSLDWASEDESLPLLIFANRARRQVGALHPVPAAPRFDRSGP